MAFNGAAKGVDIRFVSKVLAAPSGNVDAYTSLNNNVISVLEGLSDAFNADLAAWYPLARAVLRSLFGYFWQGMGNHPCQSF